MNSSEYPDDSLYDDGPPSEELEPIVPGRTMSSRSRVQLRAAAEIRQMQDPPWIVEGVVAEGAFAALYGPPAVFKTFIVLAIAFCIATGLRWMGRAVRSGTVVYLAAEGAGGLRRRMAAWELAYGEKVTNLYFVTEPISFLDSANVSDLIAALLDLPERPILLVVDTLARSFGPGDENSTRDMNLFITAIDRIREAVGCAVLVVHHTPHQCRKLRGSSTLPGALDTIIAVER